MRQFVTQVAAAIIRVLDSYGVDGDYREEDPGITINGHKVGFLGFSVKHNVTAHGFALNIGRDIKGFEYIVPCGRLDRNISSLEGETGRRFSMYDVYWRCVTAVGSHFEETLEEVFVDEMVQG